MMVSRVQRVTRRPPAVFADGGMCRSVPLVAARLVDERHQAALATRLEPRRRTRANGLPDVDVGGGSGHASKQGTGSAGPRPADLRAARVRTLQSWTACLLRSRPGSTGSATRTSTAT